MLKLGRKSIVMIGVVVAAATLMAGLSYAWFTDLDTAEAGSFEAGYLQIKLDADDHERPASEIPLIYPGDTGYEVSYTITNNSSTAVVAKIDLAGKCLLYLIPSDDLETIGEVEYVKDSSRMKLNSLNSMTPEEKIASDLLVETPFDPVVHGADVNFGLKAGDWVITDGNELSNDGETLYVFLKPGGTVAGEMVIDFKKEAGNKYQYAIMKYAGVEAAATQPYAEAVDAFWGAGTWQGAWNALINGVAIN